MTAEASNFSSPKEKVKEVCKKLRGRSHDKFVRRLNPFLIGSLRPFISELMNLQEIFSLTNSPI